MSKFNRKNKRITRWRVAYILDNWESERKSVGEEGRDIYI